jgi:hypothetical protein
LLVRLLMHLHFDLYAFVNSLNHKVLLCRIAWMDGLINKESSPVRHFRAEEAFLETCFQQLIHF